MTDCICEGSRIVMLQVRLQSAPYNITLKPALLTLSLKVKP